MKTDGAASPSAGAYAWFVLAVFFVAAILSYTDRMILNLLVDPIRRDLGVSDLQVSFLQGAAFAVLYAVISLPLGRCADRFNRRNLIVGGILVWSIATALCGFARGFGDLFAARIVVGLGEAALAPAAMSMIPDYFPERSRGLAYGLFITGMTMGNGAAVVIGGALLKAFESGAFMGLAPWRAVLVVLGVCGLAVALLAVTVREPARRDSLAGAQGSSAAVTMAATLGYFRRHGAAFGPIFLAFALGHLLGYGASAWMPSVLVRRFGMSPAEVGATFGGLTLLGSGLGAVLGGVAFDRLARRGRDDAGLRFVLWAMAATFPLVIYPILPGLPWMLGVYVVQLMVNSMAVTAGLAAIQEAVPSEMRGFSVSLQAFVFVLLGLGLGPTSVAWLTTSVYADPNAVGLSIFTVSVPTSLAILALLAWALGPYRAARQAVRAVGVAAVTSAVER